MPATAAGKAISARNATTHGLFARDIVLPSLGEDPEGYRQLEHEFTAQLAPRNLLERHYVEKIAAASWRLRRLHRWQAQVFEDESLTEDQRLDKLDTVLRHETALHRQIDTAVKMLNKDVPQLSASRAREQALWDTMQTELDCRENRENELEVTFEAREHLKKIKQATASPPLDYDRLDAARLDAAPAPAQSVPAQSDHSLSDHSLSDHSLSDHSLSDSPMIGGGGAIPASPVGENNENCQNELLPPCLPLAPPVSGGRVEVLGVANLFDGVGSSRRWVLSGWRVCTMGEEARRKPAA